MPTYNVNPVDGIQVIKSDSSGLFSHDIAFNPNGTPVGTITVKGKKAGSTVFEDIPDGTFDLSDLNTVQFVGSVFEYQFDISGISGINSLIFTDSVN